MDSRIFTLWPVLWLVTPCFGQFLTVSSSQTLSSGSYTTITVTDNAVLTLNAGVTARFLVANTDASIVVNGATITESVTFSSRGTFDLNSGTIGTSETVDRRVFSALSQSVVRLNDGIVTGEVLVDVGATLRVNGGRVAGEIVNRNELYVSGGTLERDVVSFESGEVYLIGGVWLGNFVFNRLSDAFLTVEAVGSPFEFGVEYREFLLPVTPVNGETIALDITVLLAGVEQTFRFRGTNADLTYNDWRGTLNFLRSGGTVDDKWTRPDYEVPTRADVAERFDLQEVLATGTSATNISATLQGIDSLDEVDLRQWNPGSYRFDSSVWGRYDLVADGEDLFHEQPFVLEGEGPRGRAAKLRVFCLADGSLLYLGGTGRFEDATLQDAIQMEAFAGLIDEVPQPVVGPRWSGRYRLEFVEMTYQGALKPQAIPLDLDNPVLEPTDPLPGTWTFAKLPVVELDLEFLGADPTTDERRVCLRWPDWLEGDRELPAEYRATALRETSLEQPYTQLSYGFSALGNDRLFFQFNELMLQRTLVLATVPGEGDDPDVLTEFNPLEIFRYRVVVGVATLLETRSLDSDDDGDGLPLRLELALGLNPKAPDLHEAGERPNVFGRPRSYLEDGWLYLEYALPTQSVLGLEPVAEWTEDLRGSWREVTDNLGLGIQSRVVESGSGYELHQAALLLIDGVRPQAFLRLRVPAEP